MPELPDVEVFRRRVAANGLRRPIRAVTLSSELVKDGSAQKLRERLRGSELESTKRHGKNLFISISGGGWLLLHFGMTGDVEFFETKKEKPRYTKLLLEFSDGGYMAFENMRKLGRIGLVEDVDEFVSGRRLGPDVFDGSFGAGELAAALKGRTGSIKAALMNQEIVAGLGNIYTDEVLFHAGIHPGRAIDELSRKEIGEISRRIRQVLRMAIDREVDADEFPRTYMLPHRSKRGSCPKCGREWTITTIGGRTTYFCEHDQG